MPCLACCRKEKFLGQVCFAVQIYRDFHASVHGIKRLSHSSIIIMGRIYAIFANNYS